MKRVSSGGSACGRWGWFLAAILGTLPGWAASVVLTPAADTTLQESNPDHNLGGNANFAVGTTAQGQLHRGMVRFDLAGALPAGAVIQSAQLELEMTADASSGAGELEIGVHRVLASWVEGGGTGNQGLSAEMGEVTWNRRAHPEVGWAGPGAAPGQDYVSQPSAALTVRGVGIWSWSRGLAEDVRLWWEDAASNHGWILVSAAEGTLRTSRRFAAREDAARAPRLTIEYALAPAEVRLPLPVIDGSELRWVLSLAAGRVHTLEEREGVEGGAWATVVQYPAEPAAREVSFATPLGAGRRFYRLRVEP